jgi:YggT family protein
MRYLIDAYIIVIIADSVLSYVPQYRTQEWGKYLKKIADLSLNPIRKLLPEGLPLDFSPLVVIMVLQFLRIIF